MLKNDDNTRLRLQRQHKTVKTTTRETTRGEERRGEEKSQRGSEEETGERKEGDENRVSLEHSNATASGKVLSQQTTHNAQTSAPMNNVDFDGYVVHCVR